MIHVQQQSRSANGPLVNAFNNEIQGGSSGPSRKTVALCALRRSTILGLLVFGLVFAAFGAQAESAQSTGPIDLNRATAEQLAALPGIGATKAAAIVEYRGRSGPFKALPELEAVRGIGPALIAKLRPLVTLDRGSAKSAGKNAARPQGSSAK